MKTTEPYSPRARGRNDRAKPVRSARHDGGKDHAPECLPTRGTRLAAASSDSRSISSIAGCSVRTTNGSPINVKGDHNSERRNAALIPSGSSIGRSSRFGVHGCEGDAENGGRQGEGQIDQSVDESLARDRVANERPGDHQAEDGVDRRGDERRAERLACRKRPRAIPRRLPESAPAHRRALDHEPRAAAAPRGSVEHRVAHRQAEAG